MARPWFLVFFGLLLITVEVAAQAYPIVYVRCPRTTGMVEYQGEVVINGVRETRTRLMRGADIYDRLPDVVHFFGPFNAPCDLVYRTSEGAERILYNCTATSSEQDACAAMDPAVSFDGRTIAFAVFRGKLGKRESSFFANALDPAAENQDIGYWEHPVPTLETNEARLHLVDVASGRVTPLPHSPGEFDSGPTWLSNGRIAFTSTRGKVFRTLVPGNNRNEASSQIFTMDLDGRNLELASVHALAGEQHPLQLMDGRVAYSSWQLFGSLPFRTTNGRRGGFGTLANFFHIHAQNPDGSHPFAVYGQHLTKHPADLGPNHKAAHFIGQSSDGRLWTTDYYRRNNFGLGVIVGFPLPPDGQEGLGPDRVGHGDLYRPEGTLSLADWANSNDGFGNLMPDPPYRHPAYRDPLAFAGKLGHPTGVPGNGLLVTWGKGVCGSVASNDVLGEDPPPGTSGSGRSTPLNTLTHLGRDNPGCDTGIYRFDRIPAQPSTHPADLTMVVDTPEWHELMARPVVAYREIYGIDAPARIAPAAVRAAGNPSLPPGTPFGLLGASSMILRETHPQGGIAFAGESQWGLQGTDTVEYDDDEICGLRILAVQPNQEQEKRRLFTATGERVVILGEIPVRNLDGKGTPIHDAMGNPDTSFLVRFPANTPYLMQGIDCLGRTLNSDQTWQHLRPGEKKTCNGCHVHSKPGLDFSSTIAARADYQPMRLGEGEVPLLAGQDGKQLRQRSIEGYGLQLEFHRDIMPIFERHCIGCHSGSRAEANLRLDVPGTGEDSTWHCLVRDNRQRCIPKAERFTGDDGNANLRRPQLTRYLRFMNARGSLLYWKAANQRTDNRSDDRFGEGDGDFHDLDFGADHPTGISDEELGLLSRWIDIGAPAGEGTLLDTTPPALSLVAEVEQGAVVALRVGTVDVPSGIDPGSLRLCVLDEAGNCGTELPTDAAPHGIKAVPLPDPLSDPDLEVRVEVTDRAGNHSSLTRTLGYLLGQPPDAAMDRLRAGKPPPVSGASAHEPNPVLAAIPDNVAFDLGAYECEPWPTCATNTAYSGMVYDRDRHQMLIFGGGHSATYRDDVEIFDYASLTWKPAYPPTPCEERTLENVDAQRAMWRSSGLPISRHSYDLLAMAGQPSELWLLAKVQGRGSGCHKLPPVSDDGTSPYVIAQGTFAAYHPDTQRWRFTETPAVGFEAAAATDPVSGRILLVSRRQGIGSVDPADGSHTAHVPIEDAELRASRGVSLVYFPPNDRFYVIALVSEVPAVWEVHFDRDNPAASSIQRLAGVEPPEAPVADAWDYDAANQVIGGGIDGGRFFAFDPQSKRWHMRQLQSANPELAVGDVDGKALAYDPVNELFLFRTTYESGRRTWAYRWGG